MPSSNALSAADLPTGRFAGRSDFQSAVRAALACAAQEGWREIVLSDANFHDWPLGEREVITSLQAWAKSGRHMTLLAGSYDEVVRRHPRFVQWRGTWDHLITCRRAVAVQPQDVPSALWSPFWALQRLDAERCTGVSGPEPDRRVLLRETLNEWLLRRSGPGFPASTLGL